MHEHNKDATCTFACASLFSDLSAAKRGSLWKSRVESEDPKLKTESPKLKYESPKLKNEVSKNAYRKPKAEDLRTRPQRPKTRNHRPKTQEIRKTLSFQTLPEIRVRD